MKLRLATILDAESIYDIWRERNNEASPFVKSELVFYESRLALGSPNFPFWICEVEGRIIGWACLSPMRTNPAILETMAELSFYVCRQSFGNGVASRLLAKAIDFAINKSEIEWIHAWVSDKNEASIRAVERIGGVQASVFKPVNRKPTRDTILLYSIPVTGLANESNP